MSGLSPRPWISARPAAPSDEYLIRAAVAVMEDHWQPAHGFTVPHLSVYPLLWLWDSCFHSIIWAHLGDGRAVSELGSVLTYQRPDGFVPHMSYHADPPDARRIWGQPGHSTLTQPPMYGHALRVLHTCGFPVGHLADPVRRGFRYLFSRRRAPCGLIQVLHPWESGCDDSPRWGRWQATPFDREAWGERKRSLLTAALLDDGVAVANDEFDVCPASFNALVAWNAIEAGTALGDQALVDEGRRLAALIDELLWVEDAGTWRDVDAAGRTTSQTGTAEALVGALTTPDEGRAKRVLARLVDPASFGLRYGPAGVNPAEATYDPDGYWRGGSWPHVNYLLWEAARRRGFDREARELARRLIDGAARSGLAEYWNPATGEGCGARPQSWSCLSIIPLLGRPRS